MKQVVFLSQVNVDDVLHSCATFCGFVNSFKDQPVFPPWAIIEDSYVTMHSAMDIWTDILQQMEVLGQQKLLLISCPFFIIHS